MLEKVFMGRSVILLLQWELMFAFLESFFSNVTSTQKTIFFVALNITSVKCFPLFFSQVLHYGKEVESVGATKIKLITELKNYDFTSQVELIQHLCDVLLTNTNDTTDW